MRETNDNPAGHRPRRWAWLRTLAAAALAVVLIEYLAIPQVIRATSDLTLLADASVPLLALGFGLELASLMSYTGLTRAVTPRPVRLSYGDQFRIDLTGLGFSHVMPGGGASAAALRFRLMVDRGVPASDAASTAAVQTGMAVIALVATLAGGVALAGPGIRSHPGFGVAGIIAAAVLGLVALGARSMSQSLPSPPAPEPATGTTGGRTHAGGAAQWLARRTATGLSVVLLTARRTRTLVGDRRQLAGTVGWAIGNWLLDAASLWVCLYSYGSTIHPAALFMAYGAANLIGLLPVTPGGLGVIEGVLIPALTALGAASAAPVTLGVLTWRLFEYWLPIPVAGCAFLSLKLQRGAEH